ncbi:MAG: polysaccharide deacetylase family protein [Clostridia bacterium]|nr:polysaccharide deacetylase family protein [Clostridia bacterium]
MSVQSKAIGMAKKLKRVLKEQIKANTPIYISPVRRINGVKLNQRICAMTFDDGPYNMLPNPNTDGGDDCLTVKLLKTLEKHNAKGTFDCIGDTSSNYPDKVGDEGTALWGGVAYDHYPDFGKDELAGIAHCSNIVDRILNYGHEVTNHTYVHRIWGKKPFIYGDRAYMGNITEVVDDLKRFHDIMLNDHGSKTLLSRPPHYVDKIDKNFTSYDAYAVMGYQYMGAGPDGGGWLPGKSYEEEVEAMVKAIEAPLAANPDAFCGAIIFQKDGCNMVRRTPVADALDAQLSVLDKYGYKVVTVSQLMVLSQFEDLGPDDDGYEVANSLLEKGMCPAYNDNRVHLEKMPNKEELAMILYGWQAARERVADEAKLGSAYKYAMKIAKENGTDLDAILEGCTCKLDVLKKINS